MSKRKVTKGDAAMKLERKKSYDYPWIKQATQDGYTPASKRGWYNTKEWKSVRNVVLSEAPLCRMCLAKGIATAATVCDHIKPVTNETTFEEFIDINNLQPLCDRCHRVKTNQDRGKYREDNLQKGQDLMDELES